MTGALVSRSHDPRILVSLHDISPLTLPACQEAVKILVECGLPVSALTCLVVPFHESKQRIDEDPATMRWLRELEGDGAQLVVHGYTHRMEGKTRGLAGWWWGRVWARGQGELWNCEADDVARRLAASLQIFRDAKLEQATTGFVPPAWLLSPAALAAVRGAGFAWYELVSGIVRGDELLARRLIGWGSLSEVEARATALWARLQTWRGAADTRLCVHPPDITRASSRRSVKKTMQRVLAHHVPQSYAQFLAVA